MTKHKTNQTGAVVRVEPMPLRALLEDAPPEVVEAVEALEEANRVSTAAARAVLTAGKARRLAEVPSTFPALDDEIHAAEVEARERLRDAQGAARSLARVLDVHADGLRARGARRAVERHVQACDAYADLCGSLTASPLPRAPHELAAHVDPMGQTRAPDLGSLGRYLDEADVEGLLSAAGMTAAEAGLVLVVRESGPGVRVLTTRKRAGVMAGGWAIVEDEEVSR